MNELDILKDHWKKTTNFPKKSKEELQKIIQRRSSNLLKWIIGINILEFAFFLSLSFVVPQDNIDLHYPFFVTILSAISYTIPVYFIYNYIVLIRKINVTYAVCELMKNILKTRKLLNQYIIVNISLMIFSALFGVYIGVNESSDFPDNSNEMLFVLAFVLIFMTIMILIIWLFYKLIYGFFLKRLDKNYQELKNQE